MLKFEFIMKRILSLIVSLFIVHLVAANDSDTVRTIRFLIYSESGASAVVDETGESEGIPRIQFSYFNAGEANQVDESAHRFLGPYTAQVRNNLLTIYKPNVLSLDALDESDILARIQVPEDWSNILLYCRRMSEGQPPQFIMLSDLAVLKKNKQTFCVNMTGQDIVVNIENQTFKLSPYERGALDFGELDKVQTKIKVAAQWKDEWNLVLSTTRRLRTTSSNLLLFKGSKSNPTMMSLKVVRIPDLSERE